MPIVGGTSVLTTTLGSTTTILAPLPTVRPDVVLSSTAAVATSSAPTFNASEYSHSTVFVTSEANDSSYIFPNLPPLTTIYTPPATCVERWMLAGGQVVTRTIATTQATADSAVPPLITPTATLPQSFVAQSLTVFSLNLNGTATDPSYRICQPYKAVLTYSPGICPYGQTVAEITAWQSSVSTGFHTFWQASCCKSGMTFGPEFERACISTFSSSLPARALLTTTPSSGASPTASYEFSVSIYMSMANSWAISTTSSVTTLSTGLAVADPIIIAWQIDDFRLFPADYASSLAKRIGVTLPTSTGDGSRQINPVVPGQNTGLSAGAKAGIGIAAAIGAIMILAIVLLCLRRKRKTAAQHATQEHPISEMADQDHDLAKKKWWIAGKWRNEAQTHVEPQELEDKTVHIVPGPPVELDGAELQHPDDAGRPVFRQ